jgi:hypothetical protein
MEFAPVKRNIDQEFQEPSTAGFHSPGGASPTRRNLMPFRHQLLLFCFLSSQFVVKNKEAFATLHRPQAHAHVSSDRQIHVSPQVLRHTFLCKVAKKKGVHYPWRSRDIGATAKSGAL